MQSQKLYLCSQLWLNLLTYVTSRDTLSFTDQFKREIELKDFRT